MIEMEIEDIAALFAGATVVPAVWQIYLLMNPAAREEPPGDPTTKIIGLFGLLVASTVGAMSADTPVDLFFAGVGSYALVDGLNTAVKVAYPPAAIATPLKRARELAKILL